MDIRIKKSIEVIHFIVEDLALGNVKKLSEELGFDRPERLYKIVRGKSAISRNLASIIHEKYPQYSIEWLLTGVKAKEETTLYFEKEGVKVTIDELAAFVVANEEAFMKQKVFANMVGIKVAKKVAQITASKEDLLAYLKSE
ncbi:conserved protein of unknown function [Tenacibaculum sp. 190524A02b]|uniref:hypothetical protein n=1 Tax=Tenacibaculum vairaonense TaxID=3137860 RepID=UPI0032B23452